MKRLPWIVLVASTVLSIAVVALVWLSLSSGRPELLLVGLIGLAIQLTIVSTRRAQTQSLAHDWTVIGGVRRLEQRGSELRRRLEAVEQSLADTARRQATAGSVKVLRADDAGRHAQVRKHLDALGRRMDALLEAEESRAQEAGAEPPARLDASIDAQVARTAAQFDWLARSQRNSEQTLAELLARVERLAGALEDDGASRDHQMVAAGEASST